MGAPHGGHRAPRTPRTASALEGKEGRGRRADTSHLLRALSDPEHALSAPLPRPKSSLPAGSSGRGPGALASVNIEKTGTLLMVNFVHTVEDVKRMRKFPDDSVCVFF